MTWPRFLTSKQIMTAASKQFIPYHQYHGYNTAPKPCLSADGDDSHSFLYLHHFPFTSAPRTWSTLRKSQAEEGRKVHLSISLPGFPDFPHSAPYLTSFPTTLHYTPFAVVRPVSPRHPTHSSGPFLALECPPPSSSPIYPSDAAPLLLHSFLKYLLNAHSVQALCYVPGCGTEPNR